MPQRNLRDGSRPNRLLRVRGRYVLRREPPLQPLCEFALCGQLHLPSQLPCWSLLPYLDSFRYPIPVPAWPLRRSAESHERLVVHPLPCGSILPVPRYVGAVLSAMQRGLLLPARLLLPEARGRCDGISLPHWSLLPDGRDLAHRVPSWKVQPRSGRNQHLCVPELHGGSCMHDQRSLRVRRDLQRGLLLPWRTVEPLDPFAVVYGRPLLPDCHEDADPLPVWLLVQHTWSEQLPSVSCWLLLHARPGSPGQSVDPEDLPRRVLLPDWDTSPRTVPLPRRYVLRSRRSGGGAELHALPTWQGLHDAWSLILDS